ncbi:unnamed protein product [Rotaria socialis]|uniref:Uncharacterized protein n=1 Tax=Rotaria socialis TaxID=392032 RepID=A0A817SY79_9BILA|nr:unnamed protein product [Rotaria socialis]
MALYGCLLYVWLPSLVFLLQAFHGGFAQSYYDDDNNGGYDPNALCSEDPTTFAMVCTCNAGYTNTGSDDNVVCTDSCTIKNGGCGPEAACTHDATTNAVECIRKTGYTNRGSASEVKCTDTGSASEKKRTDTGFASGDIRIVNIPANAKWSQNGVTIAGGHGQGGATNQLNSPIGLFVDDDQTVVIADMMNHCIIQWKSGDTANGQVVAGGNGKGNGLHQLYGPIDVLIDKETDSLIICDNGNQRVVRWSRRSGTTHGEVLIDYIACYGLAMDEQRYLYVSHHGKHEVRRYKFGENIGTLVAGGNGQGAGLNQLNGPTYLFVGQDHSVYVSDYYNARVMKWNKGAKEGIVVAGGQGGGSALTQLSAPYELFVDTVGTLYVADAGNARVMRWTQGAKQGTVVVGGNGVGAGANQIGGPYGLFFDQHGNLYVTDWGNHRVQRFSIE